VRNTLVLMAAILAALAATSCAQTLESQSARDKVNPKDGLTYVWIPPGSFEMGCLGGECIINELPKHSVILTRGYWIGQTLVTQAAYRKVTGANPSNFKGDQLPVENVSWDDAKAYCETVGMRLPTEAEWEYAARGGLAEARYAPLDQIAWYRGNSKHRTQPVGQKQANPYRLYDMLGNVWEWAADWYAHYDFDSVLDPKGPATGRHRVFRGGSWDDLSSDVRVSVRDHLVADDENGNSHPYADYTIGFRCAGD
jgi:formylglycine-generating enzyme required for sulfatase activity